ncbi:cytoplasm to vacuole targeting Vps64, putative [Talaromyces stipitatus ATCC 10500]|uniref:Cytoplasm to vacuole targeting Vps64, putative n=1 Tax=Talaromyces stipitatus (strain ATCC 10500 / CBS 375.48 / QM 6759 / NRRL 1006) TaxID=441959 RepID=B8M6X3_TALSN|nr:cytoplasm to vacuole targeting Vps64, putative [Talaromyces stipitatus ATCC 10500]EED20193.1 cytoplasm to vacuole targeting Vps64, putative [Talaromyces stipitatus ATCC 10500]
MTAVASPPSVQSGPRLGWYSSGNGGQAALGSMNTDDVSRMFMPRKSVQRSNSSSSLSSNASTSSTNTVSHISNGTSTNGESATWSSKRKAGRGLWPATKSEPVSGITNVRSQPVSASTSTNGGPTASSAMSAIHQPSPVPSQHMIQSPQQNGLSAASGMQGSSDPPAILTLVPLNGTFEKKHITVPYMPEVLRIGRQTNAKTIPTPVNGYFDSKVLSRQHAEIWADRRGKIWIRDIKSSNGTFVNGQRLSPESRESEPHELRENDALDLGIDIVSEDQKSIVHHKVSAKVEYAGIYNTGPNIFDLNFGDIDPTSGGGLLPSPLSQPVVHLRGRASSSLSNRSVQSAASSQMSALHQQRQMNYWISPITIEHVVKRLTTEIKQAKQQALDLRQTDEFLQTLISSDGSDKDKLNHKLENNHRQMNGRAKMSRIDPLRFSEPPAPPPQQPLPEKPDVARRSAPDPLTGSLKRSDTEKPSKDSASKSPVSTESSQILSLIEALSLTKKELEAQNSRVKELEELLRQERSARENAEESRKQEAAEHPTEPKPNEQREDVEPDVSQVDEATKTLDAPSTEAEVVESKSLEDPVLDAQTQKLQQQLDNMVTELAEMKQQVETFKQRAEKAEGETVEVRKTLAEMIETIRQERELAAQTKESALTDEEVDAAVTDLRGIGKSEEKENRATHKQPSPHKIKELEHAVTSLTQQRKPNMLEHSGPYASMVGVVLLGIGLMAYLNGWQKIER